MWRRWWSSPNLVLGSLSYSGKIDCVCVLILSYFFQVTTHLTSQLLKRHDEQYSDQYGEPYYTGLQRRASARSAQIAGHVQSACRRTSVPTWSYVEKKNSRNRSNRPVCRMHGSCRSRPLGNFCLCYDNRPIFLYFIRLGLAVSLPAL